MARYTAYVAWERNGEQFTDNRYSRRHQWQFDGGVTVRASSSPHVVPEPLSDPAAVDPEEAYIAAISSCHMLWFLSLAARRGFVIDSYEDRAKGIMEEDETGRPFISEVTLRPRLAYDRNASPDSEEESELHHLAHEKCFIANSVKTEIVILTEES